MSTPELVQILREKSIGVSAVVHEAKTMPHALDLVMQLCAEKPNCVLLVDEVGAEKGEIDPEMGLPRRVERILAAPDLEESDFAYLAKLCAEKNYKLLRTGIRNHLAGIDIAVNQVPYVIADSATCVMQTTNEESLLSSSICELSVLVVKKSGLVASLIELAPNLSEFMSKPGGNYTSFITGPSRTADIEQVLAIGVHGPLELHIILLDD